MSEAWSTPLPTNTAAVAAATMPEPIDEATQKWLAKERLPVTPDGVLMLWQRTKDTLAAAKEAEMSIRKTAVKVYVPQAHEGMNNVELGNGYTLKAGIKFNYNLDKDNAKVEAALDAIAKIGNEGPFIADRLVSWTPNFLLTEYRALEERKAGGDTVAAQMLGILASVLTITDAAPTLEIKEPKAKK